MAGWFLGYLFFFFFSVVCTVSVSLDLRDEKKSRFSLSDHVIFPFVCFLSKFGPFPPSPGPILSPWDSLTNHPPPFYPNAPM